MLGHADRVRTKVKRTAKETVELERYSEGPDGFRISVYISLSKGAKTIDTKTGLVVVDSVAGHMPGAVDIGIYGQNADKSELVKNAGFAFGEGLRKLVEKRKAKGTGSSIMSDGKAMCMFAINARRRTGEANLQIIGKPEQGFNTEHFFTFFDGLAQGMDAEVSAVVNFGGAKKQGKDQMDFVSRAFAGAVERVFG